MGAKPAGGVEFTKEVAHLGELRDGHCVYLRARFAHWAGEAPTVAGSLAGLIISSSDGRGLPDSGARVCFDDEHGTRFYGMVRGVVHEVFHREHGDELVVRHVTLHVWEIRHRFHGIVFSIDDGPRLAADGGGSEGNPNPDPREEPPPRSPPKE